MERLLGQSPPLEKKKPWKMKK